MGVATKQNTFWNSVGREILDRNKNTCHTWIRNRLQLNMPSADASRAKENLSLPIYLRLYDRGGSINLLLLAQPHNTFILGGG